MNERRSTALVAALGAGASAATGALTALDDRFAVVPALILGTGVALWLASRPRAAFVFWLAVLCTVPIWYAIELVVWLPPSSLAFLVVLPAVLRSGGRMRAPDWWLALFVVACVVGVLWFDSPEYAIGGLVAQALPAYLIGRRLAPAAGRDWAYRAVAVAAAAVAAWACVEFLLDWHVFEGPGSWRTIQTRGPVARSEGAFGHSIALGGFVAMGIPFAIGAPFRIGTRLLLLGLLAGGLICSVSRGPILGGVLAFAVAALFLRASHLRTDARWGMFAVAILGTAVVGPRVLDFFSALRADELTVSAEYRESLLAHATDDLNWLGQADQVTVVGEETLYRGVQSIDNAWLLTGLQFGWVPLIMLASLVAVCAWRVLGRYSGPAEVAMVSQAFILGTVAAITQYGPAVWMLAGMAVAFARPRVSPPEGSPEVSPARRPGAGARRPAAAAAAPGRQSPRGPGTPHRTPVPS